MTRTSWLPRADTDVADREGRRGTPHVIIAAAGLCILSVGLAGGAAEPGEEEQKPDWIGLASQLEHGDWAAAAASADRIATQVEPKRRAPDYLRRSIFLIQALMARGRAELKLGELDAAEATLLEAYRTFKDRDFQRLFSIEARLPKNIAEVVALRMRWVELLDLRSQVILERLRALNFAAATADGRKSAGEATEITAWLEELDRLAKFAADGREELATIFEKGGAKVLTSPRCRALVGPFHPAVNDGIKALELSKLARAGRPTEGPTADDLLAAARGAFKAAHGALDEALQAALPKGAVGMKPEQRIEKSLLQTELLTNQAAALIEAGELAAARASLDQAMDLHREVSMIRKRAQAAGHPDTLWPLLMTAEVCLAESRQFLAQGVADKARAKAIETSRLLDQAAQLPIPETQPLSGERSRMAAALEGQLAAIGKSIPRSDAADTAARRVRRAVDASRAAGVTF